MSADTRHYYGFPEENKDKSAMNTLDAESNCLREPMTLVNDSCVNKNLDNYVLLYDSGKTIASGVNGNNKANSSCKRRLNLRRLNAVVIGEPIDISDDEDNCDDNRTQNVHTQICNGMRAFILMLGKCTLINCINIDLIFAESTYIALNNSNYCQRELNAIVDVTGGSTEGNDNEPLHESNKHSESDYSYQEYISGDVSSPIICNISSHSNDPTGTISNNESFPSDIELATTIRPQGKTLHRIALSFLIMQPNLTFVHYRCQCCQSFKDILRRNIETIYLHFSLK